MIKTRIIKVKSIGNEEVIMAITKTKTITTVIMTIIIIMMIIRVKVGNCIKI